MVVNSWKYWPGGRNKDWGHFGLRCMHFLRLGLPDHHQVILRFQVAVPLSPPPTPSLLSPQPHDRSVPRLQHSYPPGWLLPFSWFTAVVIFVLLGFHSRFAGKKLPMKVSFRVKVCKHCVSKNIFILPSYLPIAGLGKELYSCIFLLRTCRNPLLPSGTLCFRCLTLLWRLDMSGRCALLPKGIIPSFDSSRFLCITFWIIFLPFILCVLSLWNFYRSVVTFWEFFFYLSFY